jgi:hypothetical protein
VLWMARVGEEGGQEGHLDRPYRICESVICVSGALEVQTGRDSGTASAQEMLTLAGSEQHPASGMGEGVKTITDGATLSF